MLRFNFVISYHLYFDYSAILLSSIIILCYCSSHCVWYCILLFFNIFFLIAFGPSGHHYPLIHTCNLPHYHMPLNTKPTHTLLVSLALVPLGPPPAPLDQPLVTLLLLLLMVDIMAEILVKAQTMNVINISSLLYLVYFYLPKSTLFHCPLHCILLHYRPN